MLNPVVYALTASSMVACRDAATRKAISMWVAVKESTTPCFIEITGGNERDEKQNAPGQTRNFATQVTTEDASSSLGICGGASTTASCV